MRLIVSLILVLPLAACELMPARSDAEPVDPAMAEVEPIDDTAERLADAFQLLHDGHTRRAVDRFNAILDRSSAGEPFNDRALLGKSLAYLDNDWDQYDPQRAQQLVERIDHDEHRNRSVFDWILRDTIARLIKEEIRQQESADSLAEAERQQRALRVELEQARAEQTQAEETIARLRQLIMGEE